ncbi:MULTISPECIES: replication endonuclease [unclassified Vibrio]|uniref:replication endonuclease n=1 Tax=unclassified Vibrio TaxID=2614977 RepID=UPI0027CA6EC8|nr:MULTISPECIES: replication endonuclease [unclassified Vibrio]MDQ2108610.1 replication endonuclease [Vibrio sp. 2017_1457_15]MDQ2161711.1 replication endonuclease [Vibrio sp. 2017_1457_13]
MLVSSYYQPVKPLKRPWRLPLKPIDKRDSCLVHGYQPVLIEPDGQNMIERDLYQLNPDDHQWRTEKKYFSDFPNYITKYFAKRYKAIFDKKGRAEANIYLRTRMEPAANRARLALRKYKNLPTTQKVALLSDEYENTEQNDLAALHPDVQRPQMTFDFDAAEKNRKPVQNRLLAELENDELKEMAFKISTIVFRYSQVISRQQSKDNDEISEAVTEGYEALAEFVRQFGIKPPRKYKKQTELSALQDISKMINEKWWLGRLTKARKIMREHLAIAMGQVSSKASPYASWDCIREHKEQQKRNWEFIKQCTLIDEETGEEADLADMVLKSVSNPAIRRHELMVRCRGCEDIGNELGLQGLFLTLTTPSKYHNSYKKGGFIDHWNGTSPREAQAYLNNVWQRIRAKLSREDIRWFGVRVAEPHHDGTPHWHLLIWVKPEEVSAVRDIFISYATKEDRSELHPAFEKEKQKPFRKGVYVGPLDYRPRCDFGLIDPAKGTATGYIAKYISKNIDGYAMDSEVSDETGKPVKEMAKNVSAWKSRWSIRQYQFFGGAPVTTYRELRRFANQNKKAFMEYLFMQERADLLGMYHMLNRDLVGPMRPNRLLTNQYLVEVISNSYQPRIKSNSASVVNTMRAADEGNWRGYIMGQGGPFVPRDCLLITNAYEVLPFASPHGEEVRKIEGFKTAEGLFKTRTKVWIIKKKGDDSEDAEVLGFGSEATAFGGSAASRSSVTNCTGPLSGQVSTQLTKLLQPDRLKGSVNDQVADDLTISALMKGSSVRLDDETSLQIRPAEVDAQGKTVRSARLVEIKREIADEDDDLWMRFEGWDKLLDKLEPKETNQHQQPDLSFFAEREDDWPLA